MALDIFHLSYKEPYADKTWEKLVSKFPYARRVQGVKEFLKHTNVVQKWHTQKVFM